MSENVPSSQREFAVTVVDRLRQAGHDALWAGGCVRDELMGRPPKDYDVATSALPDAVRELFGRRRTLAIGAAFGVITVQGGRELQPIEVATFRTDGGYSDGRRPDSVEFTSAEHDAQRRDFTINGLFFDPLDGRVVDYVGGVADLEARLVRAIGDPARRFAEDKLRLLRAIRFAATLDFALDAATLDAVRASAGELTQVSAERLGSELRRILTHANRRRGVELLAETGLLAPLLPELDKRMESNTAWRIAALERLGRLIEPTLPAALAAWMDGAVDPHTAKDIGRRLRLPNREIERLMWLLAALPALRQASSLRWSQLQRLLVHPGAADLLTLGDAALPAGDAGLAHCREQLARRGDELNPAPLVTGDDLRACGLRPGPHFATLLEYLRDEQLEGRLTTRDQALAAARAWSTTER